MTHTPGERFTRSGRPTYQLAWPALGGQDAVLAILDYASMVLEFAEDGTPTDPSLFSGICGALGSILSADETPADFLVVEACGLVRPPPTGTAEGITHALGMQKRSERPLLYRESRTAEGGTSEPGEARPPFILTDDGFVIQKMDGQGDYHMVARVAKRSSDDTVGETLVALLNQAAS